MAIVISPYRPEYDEPDVLSLRGTVWGDDHAHTDARFLRWLFRDNVSGTDCGVLLRRDGRPAGFAGLVDRSLADRGRDVRVAHGLDFMVDPGVRGGLSGLYATRVASGWADMAQAQGYPLGICFPNANSIRLLSSDRLGWVPVLSPRLFLRPLRSFRRRSPEGGRLRAWLATTVGRVASVASSAISAVARGSSAEIEIVEIGDFDDRFDALWSKASSTIVAFQRDRKALMSRYRGHPLYEYRVAAALRRDALDAYVVTLRRDLMGLRSDLLVDALHVPPSSAALVTLVEASAARSLADGADIVGALAPDGSGFAKALLRTGFLPVPRRFDPKPFWLMAKVFDPSAAGLLRAEGWHLTWGDMDVV